MTMKYAPSTGGFYRSDINKSIPADAVDVSDADYAALFAAQSNGHSIQPGPGGVPISVAPMPPSVAQQADMAILAGCQIVSSGSPGLGGAYAIDAESRADMQGEIISLLLNSTFTNGQTTLGWADTAGVLHTFTIPQFKAFATAIGSYVGALKATASSGSGSLPAQPVTIA